MSKLEDELIDDTIDSHGPTDQLKFGVCGIVEDEIVLIEVGELGTAYATSQLIQVVSFLSQLKGSRCSVEVRLKYKNQDLLWAHGSHMVPEPSCSLCAP